VVLLDRRTVVRHIFLTITVVSTKTGRRDGRFRPMPPLRAVIRCRDFLRPERPSADVPATPDGVVPIGVTRLTEDETTTTGTVPTAPVAAVGPPWAEIRAAYEGSTLAVAAIAEAYGVGVSAIRTRLRRENWPRRRARKQTQDRDGGRESPPLDRSVLVERLFHAVDRQITEIERRFDDVDPVALEEKDARTLGALARTLELLIGLERETGRRPDAAESDLDEFRLDLARRLESLRRAE
jgi:hypothetical protein